MKAPRHVYVGGYKIKVLVVTGMDDWGDYDRERKMIRISHKATGDDLRDTLRHEMVHAALDIGGIAYCESMQEEAIVRCLDSLFFPAWEKVVSQEK